MSRPGVYSLLIRPLELKADGPAEPRTPPVMIDLYSELAINYL